MIEHLQTKKVRCSNAHFSKNINFIHSNEIYLKNNN